MEHKELYKVREPICKTHKMGSFYVHWFSSEEKARSFAKNRGINNTDAQVLGPEFLPVVNGYVVCGKIDKEG